MELVGKIYQMWEPTLKERVKYLELQGFKRALYQEGFRWTTCSDQTYLTIHDGGDILSGNQYKVGELNGNNVLVFGSSKLEEFLESYDS